ncbi:LANO_0D08790g1_1 [Lachancea nothofagi CBS 11611]|uniref:LANO_0D08790g1_1 n=1 Tax=Lachancea nothofagi CBS 11611 TaxID=1266666 RepID=A0A1G4JJ29_9SACH|nr:LANO_0D08790g1_1 [Lachancea nothofagi CBS 11611]
MTENGERPSAEDRSSIYEDASTLLMLSRGKDDGAPIINTGFQNTGSTPSAPHSRTGSHSNSEPRSPIAKETRSDSLKQDSSLGISPVSASAILPSNPDGSITSQKRDKPSSPSSRSNSSKGMVAAAALAAAATVPLPLRRQDQERRASKPRRNTNEESTEQKDALSWPVPSSYVVDPDAGTITCICGFDDDDGFTIQCDHCNRWQHAICFGIRDIETAPDDHLCSTCQPRKVDVKRAKKRQQERLNPKNTKRRRKSNQEEDQTGKNTTSDSVDSANTSTNNSSNHELGAVPEIKAMDKLLTAMEHYSVVYVPLSSNDYKDRYVQMFLEKHCDDDWVIPYTYSTFQPISLEVRSYAENARTFSGLPKLGLFTQQDCPSGTFLEELLGEVDFSKKYFEDSRNNYRVYGTTKPKVLMHPHWPICIDSRLSGNLTRFLRRSCKPNVELVSIRLNNDTPNVKFVLRALRDLEDGEELHIGWQWDLRHPIWQLIKGENKTVDSLDDQNKFTLVHSIDTILGSTDCACGNNNRDCYLLKVKKFSQSLVKSVKSKMNSRYKLGEILQAAKEGTNKVQTPILSRLAHEAISNAERANEILVDFHAAKLKYLKEEGVLNGRSDSRSKIDTVVSGKPFKFYLIDKHFALTRKGDAKSSERRPIEHAGHLNALQFDESHISDLNALPIPIELQVPHIPSIINNSAISNGSAPQDVLLEPTANPLPASIAVPQPAVSTTIPILDSHQQLKKKLSFADYKKKMKPI